MPTIPIQAVRRRNARAAVCALEDPVTAAVTSVTAAIGGMATGAYMNGFWNAPRKWSAPASIDVPASPSADRLASALEARLPGRGGTLSSLDTLLLTIREA